MTLFKSPLIWLVLSLTIGLAPFTPEPHLWGKIKWIAGGANGMALLDWFDFFFHLFPWVGLLISLGFWLRSQTSKPKKS